MKHDRLAVVLACVHDRLPHRFHCEQHRVLGHHRPFRYVDVLDVATPQVHSYRIYLAWCPRQVGVYAVTPVAAPHESQEAGPSRLLSFHVHADGVHDGVTQGVGGRHTARASRAWLPPNPEG